MNYLTNNILSLIEMLNCIIYFKNMKTINTLVLYEKLHKNKFGFILLITMKSPVLLLPFINHLSNIIKLRTKTNFFNN